MAMNHQMAAQGGFRNNRQFSADDLQRLSRSSPHAMMNNMVPSSSMDDASMGGGQSLDDLVNQNSVEQHRRSAYNPQIGGTTSNHERGGRRLSMLEFGSVHDNNLDRYQFSPASLGMNSPTALPNGGGIARRRMEARQAAQRRESTGNTSLDTQFQDLTPDITNMAQSPLFQQSMSGEPMNMDDGGDFVPDLDMSMDLGNGMTPEMSGDLSGMSMYSSNHYGLPVTSMTTGRGVTLLDMSEGTPAPPGTVPEQAIMEKMPQMKMTDLGSNNAFSQSMNFPRSVLGPSQPRNHVRQGEMLPGGNGVQSNFSSLTPQQINNSLEEGADMPSTQNNFSTGAPMPNAKSQPNMPQYLNAYSSTGFDMLGVLMRVATRSHPRINIGAVDMSCAFVVCDVTQHDVPIVYCSEMFDRLTGYSRHEILGRNCRFLQAPDGKVQAGLKRKYVDDSAVLHLKNMINLQSEAQISLINYRKGGQPFMNLLTMIPISCDTDDIKFYVGFQVDLVEQPTSITNKNPGQHTLS